MVPHGDRAPAGFRGRMARCLRVAALALGLATALPAGAATATMRSDPVAENMLRLQTASGGWSKHYRGRAVDYRQPLDEAALRQLRDPARVDDATIDNNATTSEIAYLARAYRDTGNPAYLEAARRGV